MRAPPLVVLMILLALPLSVADSALDAFVDPIPLPLTWVGRGAEFSDRVVVTDTMGSGVAAALAIPLERADVFDNGHATPWDFLPTTPGVQWASWNVFSDLFHWESRHMRATFEFPSDGEYGRAEGMRQPWSRALDLYAYVPQYADKPQYDGDILASNANIYLFLNGRHVATVGPFYRGTHLEPTTFAEETDGWLLPGALPASAADALVVGTNTMDLVLERPGGWGGLTAFVLEARPGVG